jgi:hypothetical protein
LSCRLTAGGGAAPQPHSYSRCGPRPCATVLPAGAAFDLHLRPAVATQPLLPAHGRSQSRQAALLTIITRMAVAHRLRVKRQPTPDDWSLSMCQGT